MRIPKDHAGETDNMFPEPTADQVPLTPIITELRREFAMRKSVYPKWVEAGKIDPEVAAARMLYVEAAILWLDRLASTAIDLEALKRLDQEGMTDENHTKRS
jgi:hypothetical protein